MKILDYYLERSKDSIWKNKFQSTAEKNFGKTFLHMNTNLRTLHSFIKEFNTFIAYNEIERANWAKHAKHGQEIAKHYVVNMRRSKLFNKHNNLYRLTKKGESFNKMIQVDFENNERWILIFMYIQNAYFGLKPNYFKKRVEYIINKMSVNQIDVSIFIQQLYEFILDDVKTREELFQYDIFWLITFFEDNDFIYLYQNSSSSEKTELKDYVIQKYKKRSKEDLIAYKFKPNGQYTVNTFKDDVKIIYFTKFSTEIHANNPIDYYKNLLNKYSNMVDINSKKVLNFVQDHYDLFAVIYNEITNQFESDLIEDHSIQYLTDSQTITDHIEEDHINIRVDETSAEESKKITQVSSVLKRMAKDRSKYCCELELLEDCRYFTSKDTGKNYLEIHHLVPREFANEYENSIELISNYVALCPHCHRMIHFANDRERYKAIKFLYNQRENHLRKQGIDVTINELKEYYNIEE